MLPLQRRVALKATSKLLSHPALSLAVYTAWLALAASLGVCTDTVLTAIMSSVLTTSEQDGSDSSDSSDSDSVRKWYFSRCKRSIPDASAE